MIFDLVGQIAAKTEYIIPLFLATIFAAGVLSSRSKIPYTIILVGIGVVISLLSYSNFNIVGKGFKVDPRLVIDFIIPPLIFVAMMKVNYQEFKKIRISALVLSTVGVILATIIGGYLLMYIAGLPLFVAFAFAALIAPTDAAIVIEIFKRVTVPRVLATLMESEASFNDATGVIAFSSILAIAIGSGALELGSSSSAFTGAINVNLTGEAEHFSIVFLGGAAIGLAVAAGAQRLHTLMDEPFSEIALTIAMVFGSVALANSLGFSGLIAAAVTGLYFGNVTIRKESVISERTRNSAFSFWEMIAFFANSVAFLYLGLTMDILKISQNLWIIGLAFASVMAARAASAYPILGLINRFTKERIPLVWRNVVVIGGMRGALSVALAASLPESNFKFIIETLTFGVVLSSLLIQFTILSQYVKKAFVKDVVAEV